MTSFNLSEIGELLKDASQKSASTGVSFAGKSLKLNSEEDGMYIFCLNLLSNYFNNDIFISVLLCLFVIGVGTFFKYFEPMFMLCFYRLLTISHCLLR